MDEEQIRITVQALRDAGIDSLKQVSPLLKLGEWYLMKANASLDGADFTKANALFNAAYVRCPRVNSENIDKEQVRRRIVETYRDFLSAFANDDKVSVDEIQNEIESHAMFLANERKILKDRVDEIDSCYSKSDKTYEQLKVGL